MSFERLLDRVVTIQPRSVSSSGTRGDVFADDAPIAGVKTARDLLVAEEDTGDNREQQSKRFRYFFPRTVAGAFDGHARIVDGVETLEIDGEPEIIVRRRTGKTHHVEVIAYVSTG